MPINILILAAGGTANDTDLDEYPSCLTEVGGWGFCFRTYRVKHQ